MKPFKVGSIIEHHDKSIYVVGEEGLSVIIEMSTDYQRRTFFPRSVGWVEQAIDEGADVTYIGESL